MCQKSHINCLSAFLLPVILVSFIEVNRKKFILRIMSRLFQKKCMKVENKHVPFFLRDNQFSETNPRIYSATRVYLACFCTGAMLSEALLQIEILADDFPFKKYLKTENSIHQIHPTLGAVCSYSKIATDFFIKISVTLEYSYLQQCPTSCNLCQPATFWYRLGTASLFRRGNFCTD